jgi:protein-L-isoaspartate(D-aspartate) O-methyltransferase
MMDAERLRAELADSLRADQIIESAQVEAAVRAVPRHLFLPGVPLKDAYADKAVVTKKDANGAPSSSASQPAIVVRMLEQLDVRPGHRVLEIGAGTGYNAALLRTLGGSVTTVDIDPEVAAEARDRLPEETTVVCADGTLGYPPNAPYDRIIVTAGAADLPPAWFDQLATGGRLVVPLRLAGMTRSIAFDLVGGHLVSRSTEVCGFIPMRTDAPDAEQVTLLSGHDVVLVAGAEHQVDREALQGVLASPRLEIWTAVRAGSEEHLNVWLAASVHAARMYVFPAAEEAGLAPATGPIGTAASAEGGSLAYLVRDGETLGVYAHGPDGGRLGERLAHAVIAWDEAGRPDARIDAYPAGATVGHGSVLLTPNAQLVLFPT